MANFITSDVNNPTPANSVFFHVLSFPQYISVKLNYLARTGVDGFSVWRTGLRGEAFQVVTFADFGNFKDAFDEYQTKYMALRGQRRSLVYENAYITSEYLDVAIIDVQPAGAGRSRGVYNTLKTVGGLQTETDNGGIVRARWTLLGLAKGTI